MWSGAAIHYILRECSDNASREAFTTSRELVTALAN